MFGFIRFKLLIATATILLTITNAIPVQRKISRHGLLARQIELTTTEVSVLIPKTPYPAAGYRPHIPFELPNETRQGKGLPEQTTTTTTTTTTQQPPTIPTPNPTPTIEDFDIIITTTPSSSQKSTSSVEEQDEQLDLNIKIEQDVHIPDNTYGAPRPNPQNDSTEIVDNTIVENIKAPANRFQPPNKEAVEDFGKINVDGEQTAIAIGTATSNNHDGDLPESSLNEEEDLNSKSDQVYGPPTIFAANGQQVPAIIYGAPNLMPTQPEISSTTDSNENELVPFGALAPQQFQRFKNANRLQSGRLIFVPADGTQLRQIYFANIPETQQQTLRGSNKLLANKRF